jgi:aryl-alcohol dehydrogenase-like predicted oxidoreductase
VESDPSVLIAGSNPVVPTAGQGPRQQDRVRPLTNIAAEAGVTPAQIALPWLLAQGDDIAPIPGTKRVARVEENTAAGQVELSAEQVERLNNLTPAAGERHDEANMAAIDR